MDIKSNIKKYFKKNVILEIKNQIKNKNGNEVFFVGKLNSEKIIEKVDMIASGNKNSVAAIFQVAGQGDVVLHNHPDNVLVPSDADVSIASKFGSAGVGFYIIDNNAENVNVVVKAFDKKEYKLMETAHLKSFFVRDGYFDKNLQGYEFREQQVQMLDTVIRSFNDNKIALIEAGTGTGKSLAYLLPAIFWSVKNKERVVVSTNTINLQEQLINKDIPILSKSLPFKFKSVLIKGRNNYACLRKVDCIKDGGQLLIEIEANNQLKQLLDWALKSDAGSKEDIDFIVNKDLWDMIQCENDQCLRAKCSFFAKCFFYSSRREATSADLIIVNHHLLVADIAIRKAMDDYNTTTILPPFKKIIIDEAHNIEDVFTSSFGVRITLYRILKVFRRLQSTKDRSKGLFSYLKFVLQKSQPQINLNLIRDINALIDENLIPEWGEFYLFVQEMFTLIANDVSAHLKLKISQNDEERVRITKEFSKDSFWCNKIINDFQSIGKGLRKYTLLLKQLINKIDELPEKKIDKLASIKLDITSCLNRIQAVVNDINMFIHLEENPDHLLCRWVEVKKYMGNKSINFCFAPLNIAEDMKSFVYDKFNTIIMTSATLTVNNNFQFFKERTGTSLIDKNILNEQLLESPFDYEQQALVGIPLDIANPKEEGYDDALKKLIYLAVKTSKGRALVLFTSYNLMNRLHSVLKNSISNMGYVCMRQGEDSRHRLLENFKKDKTSVLFATDSFWQGIDVKGSALECVIVTKLPFRVPSEPIVQARAEFIEMKGGNSFYDYALPLAVIKFKQGFGRLIRSKSDRGAVLIFDKRVLAQSYGRAFINSLPKVRVVADKTEVVFKEMEEFYRTV